MSMMLRAAFATVSLASIGPAYAGEGEGAVANTRFTEIPGVVAQAPAQNTPLAATVPNGQASRSSATTWLFPPIGQYFAQNPGRRQP